MVQAMAEGAVAAGDWIEKPVAEVLAEAIVLGEERKAEKQAPNVTD